MVESGLDKAIGMRILGHKKSHIKKSWIKKTVHKYQLCAILP